MLMTLMILLGIWQKILNKIVFLNNTQEKIINILSLYDKMTPQVEQNEEEKCEETKKEENEEKKQEIINEEKQEIIQEEKGGVKDEKINEL